MLAACLWRAIELQRSLKHMFGSEIAHADWLFLRAGEDGAAGSEEAGGDRSSGDAGTSSSGAAESDSDAASVSPCLAEDLRCSAWALHALGMGSVGAFWECYSLLQYLLTHVCSACRAGYGSPEWYWLYAPAKVYVGGCDDKQKLWVCVIVRSAMGLM